MNHSCSSQAPAASTATATGSGNKFPLLAAEAVNAQCTLTFKTMPRPAAGLYVVVQHPMVSAQLRKNYGIQDYIRIFCTPGTSMALSSDWLRRRTMAAIAATATPVLGCVKNTWSTAASVSGTFSALAFVAGDIALEGAEFMPSLDVCASEAEPSACNVSTAAPASRLPLALHGCILLVSKSFEDALGTVLALWPHPPFVAQAMAATGAISGRLPI